MAVILFKGSSESVRIEPQYLPQYLQAGWQLEPEISTEEPTPDTPSDTEPEEAPGNGNNGVNIEALRAAAKEAGIDGWETKHAKTLKRELVDLADENKG